MVTFIVGPASTAELDAHLLERIARFKRPKRYVFVDELPKNSYGKVLKRELRAVGVTLTHMLISRQIGIATRRLPRFPPEESSG